VEGSTEGDGVLVASSAGAVPIGTSAATVADTLNEAAAPVSDGRSPSTVDTVADAFAEIVVGVVVGDSTEAAGVSVVVSSSASVLSSSAEVVLVGRVAETVADTLSPADAAPPAPTEGKLAEVLAATVVGVVEGSIEVAGVLVVAASSAGIVTVGSGAEIVVDTLTDAGTTLVGGVLATATGNVADTPAEIAGGIVVETLTGATEIVVGSVAGSETVTPTPVDAVGLVPPLAGVSPWVPPVPAPGDPPDPAVGVPPVPVVGGPPVPTVGGAPVPAVEVPPVPVVDAPPVGSVETGVAVSEGARPVGARSTVERVADRRPEVRG
jgi:hypothetical protein